MKLILKAIKIISFVFISINFLGCETEDKEFPTAFAEFTYTVNQETGVVKFLNTSRNATIFTWSFGDQTTSSEINPTHLYQPGTYVVSLVARNVAGSFRTFQSTIVIGGDTGGGTSDCTAETAENIDPANGDLNWTFKTKATTHTLEAFGNTAGSIVDNPLIDAVNGSCNVQEFIKTTGCETWSGLGAELATAIDFTASSTKKVFTIKVLAKNQASGVTLRLERLPFPDTDPAIERVATITQVGAWQELTFDFSDVSTGTYKSMIIYFERNTACDGDVYYFDDIKQVEGGSGGGGSTATCTPDEAQTLSAATFNMTMAMDPSANVISDNAGFEWVDNPDFENTINASCKVGKVTNGNIQPWDNIQIDLADKLSFTDGSNFKMKIYAPQSGYKVTLKLEDKSTSGAVNSGDRPSTTSTTLINGWEELTFNFDAIDSGKYDKIVLFFDLQTKNGNTYYFDDLKLNLGTGGGGNTGGGGTATGGGCTGTAVAATAFPVNFEGCQSFISTFTDAGSITTALDANPSKTGINTSDYVLKVVKASGSNRWAGFQNPFPTNFDATKTFKFKVYSTVANVVMRFEVNSDPQPNASGNPGPQFATITQANTWTEVSIVFTGIPSNNTGLNQLVIKPNNPDGTDNQTTSAEGVYYFDDFRLE